MERSSNNSQKVCTEKQISRRTFLKDLVKNTGTLGAAVTLNLPTVVLPAASLAILIKTIVKEPEPIYELHQEDFTTYDEMGKPINVCENSDEKEQTTDYPYTNTKNSFPSHTTFHNLGVEHTRKAFLISRKTILNAIQEADIVVVERVPGYFDTLGNFAKNENKEVYCIDDQGILNFLLCTGLTAPLAYGAINIISHTDLQSKKTIFAWTRRQIIALISSLFSVIPPTLVLSVLNNDKEYLGRNDISYLVDGRTYIMLTHLRTLISENPGKKILSITGDGHAKGFEYYMAHGINPVKRWFYENGYVQLASNTVKL